MKKWITRSMVVLMLSSFVGTAHAEDYCANDCSECGYGYESCCKAPCCSTYLALGAAAVVATVVTVVVLSNGSSSSSHAHNS